MDVPDRVAETLGDERLRTWVSARGDDRVYVTETRTLLYRPGGWLRSDSIEEFSHEVASLDVSAGPRQASVFFEPESDAPRSFSIPAERLDTVLSTVLSGVLATAGITEPTESVIEIYRFENRTIVVTSVRLLIHRGEHLWAREHVEYRYEDLEGVRFEQGVSTPVVLVLDDERRGIETPGDQARDVYRTIENALTNSSDGTGDTDGTTDDANEPTSERETVGSTGSTETVREPTATTTGPDHPDDRTVPTNAASEATGKRRSETKPRGPRAIETPVADRDTGIGDDEWEFRPDRGDDSNGNLTDGSAENPTAAPETERTAEPGDSVDANPEESETDGERASSPPAFDPAAIAAELDALEETVSHQHELLERQQARIERLNERLDEGSAPDGSTPDR